MKMTVFFVLFTSLSAVLSPVNPKLDKKVDKALIKFFETEEVSKQIVTLVPETIKDLPADFNERLSKLTVKGSHNGYVYVGNAPSKTASFDYMILFDDNFIIRQSKVLIYREEYGGEIGSKRWLKQFNQKTPSSDELKYGDNIAAISGATISVRSMTNAVNDVLKSLKTLKENGTL